MRERERGGEREGGREREREGERERERERERDRERECQRQRASFNSSCFNVARGRWQLSLSHHPNCVLQ